MLNSFPLKEVTYDRNSDGTYLDISNTKFKAAGSNKLCGSQSIAGDAPLFSSKLLNLQCVYCKRTPVFPVIYHIEGITLKFFYR
jgi:hypothetical protein